MGTTIPASLLMRAIGRRSGFLLASLIEIAGASCAALVKLATGQLCRIASTRPRSFYTVLVVVQATAGRLIPRDILNSIANIKGVVEITQFEDVL